MRVLITGSSGYFGCHIARRMVAAGHEVRCLVRSGRPRGHVESVATEFVEGDLLDEPSLHRACEGVDAVVNAAGVTSLWSRMNAQQWRVNVDGFAALVRAARAKALRRIVHVSSTAAIGATRDGTVLDETARWIGPVHRIHYVNSKKEAEERAKAAAWAGLPIVIVNPSMLLGPRCDGRPPSSLVMRVASGRALIVPPGGVSVVDVEDAARGVVAALERGRVGERYILAGTNVSWSDLYEHIAHVAGVRPPLVRLPRTIVKLAEVVATSLDACGLSRPRFAPEIYRSWGWTGFYDSSKARRELGFECRPLRETLRRTLAAAHDHTEASIPVSAETAKPPII